MMKKSFIIINQKKIYDNYFFKKYNKVIYYIINNDQYLGTIDLAYYRFLYKPRSHKKC